MRLKLLVLFWFVCQFSQAQTSYLQVQTLKLINEARANPARFLSDYRAQINEYEPKFIAILEKASPTTAMVWDEDITKMAMQIVEGQSLSPSYKGSNKLCGFSTSKGSGEPKPAIYFVCDMFTTVCNSEYSHYGLHLSEDDTRYAYLVGKSCKKYNTSYSFTETIDSSSVDFELINTAKNEAYMSQDEKSMIKEINFARVYPQIYAKLVAKFLHDKANGTFGLSQSELSSGLELIAELEKAQSLKPLKPDECLYNISKAHGLDCEKRGVIDHTGSDGSDPFKRLTKGCPKMLSIGENLAGNVSTNPRDPVISLLIDDGISTRGHRYTIFAPQWKYISCFRFTAKKQPNYVLFGWVQTFTR